jgi:tRNA pseudouridine55 synthase
VTRLALTCRGGYYVRALARDLGRVLGCRAHLRALHRTRIGPWKDPGAGTQLHVGAADVLPWAERRMLSDQELGVLRQGQPTPRGQVQRAPWTFPDGFPPADAPVLGLHLGRFTCLLRPAGEGALRLEKELRGGLG